MAPSQRLAAVAGSLLARSSRPIGIACRSPRGAAAALARQQPGGQAQVERVGGVEERGGLQRQQWQQRRALHTAPTRLFPRVGSEDKDSINREPIEYTRSGTDSETAEQEQAAFDPSITDPQAEKEKAGEGMGVSHENRQQRATTDNKNPLNVSPANPDVSKPRASDEGHPEHAPGEQRQSMSGGGSGMKSKK